MSSPGPTITFSQPPIPLMKLLGFLKEIRTIHKGEEICSYEEQNKKCSEYFVELIKGTILDGNLIETETGNYLFDPSKFKGAEETQKAQNLYFEINVQVLEKVGTYIHLLFADKKIKPLYGEQGQAFFKKVYDELQRISDKIFLSPDTLNAEYTKVDEKKTLGDIRESNDEFASDKAGEKKELQETRKSKFSDLETKEQYFFLRAASYLAQLYNIDTKDVLPEFTRIYGAHESVSIKSSPSRA